MTVKSDEKVGGYYINNINYHVSDRIFVGFPLIDKCPNSQTDNHSY